MSGSANLRIGIDTGGTFTDIVCVDDRSGSMRVTKVSLTPSNPAIALVRGVHAILGEAGAGVDDLAVLAHGTTVATNALLQGGIAGLGLIVTDGFRHILEIARQAVPEGYGNSYFWVKPERIVPLRYVREVGGRLNFLGEELRPDTGGTFTDIVCVDDTSGAMRVTKVSSTPANPAVALVRGVHAILGEWGAGVDDLAVLAHGTTVATNALLQGEIAGLGLIVTDGFRHILEIARQAVPEGYGNSYFWVKPERIVPLRYVREVGGRLNFLGEELRPLDEASVRAAARFFREAGIAAIGICLIHSYANPAHERRAAEIVREEYPDCTLSLSCDVLPEYREYERAVTTLVDAFIKPHMSRYLDRIRDELGPELNKKPFLVMQSSRRRRQPRSGDAQADHHGAVGARRRRARQRGDCRNRRLSRSGDARRRRHLDRSLPDRRRQAEDHQWRPRRPFPGAHPDARHQDHRHRRRLDRLDLARRQTQGGTAQRRRRARPDVLSERRRRADHHRRQSRPRPHSAGADRRRHSARRLARARKGCKNWPRGCPAI